MSNSPFYFDCLVPEGGFCWVDTEGIWRGVGEKVAKATYLRQLNPDDSDKLYQPLTDQPALFRTFAQTAPTKNAIVIIYPDRPATVAKLDPGKEFDSLSPRELQIAYALAFYEMWEDIRDVPRLPQGVPRPPPEEGRDRRPR